MLGMSMSNKRNKIGGASVGSIEVSPNKARKMAKRRREEEKVWRSKNGPVVISYTASTVKDA